MSYKISYNPKIKIIFFNSNIKNILNILNMIVIIQILIRKKSRLFHPFYFMGVCVCVCVYSQNNYNEVQLKGRCHADFTTEIYPSIS